MKRSEFWTAAGIVFSLLIAMMYLMHDGINGLRDDVREDIGKVDGNVDALRTDVTKIAEDVGYLRGRVDERDLQQTVD